MNYIGIDPGATGAMAILWSISGDHEIEVFDYSPMVWEYFPMASKSIVTVIEQVHAMPGQGVTGVFNFGMNYGWWLGVLAVAGHAPIQVSPQRWKKHFGLIGQPKDASRELAIKLFPKLKKELSLKKHHGRADALLIAKYGLDNKIGVSHG